MITTLSENHSEWLNIAFHICRDQYLADDLVQDMYLRIHKYPPKKEINNFIQPQRAVVVDGKFLLPFNKTDLEINNYYQPIPLTEEWLLKFGFELKEESFQDTLLDTFMFHKDNIVDVEFSDKHKLLYWHDNYTNVYHQEIKQVHQLQNLYFALRGEELTID